ncbi:hypothetical protein Tco_0008196 [Tanacetum coccineum]
MSSQQKRKFFKDVKHYFWDDPFLFKIKYGSSDPRGAGARQGGSARIPQCFAILGNPPGDTKGNGYQTKGQKESQKQQSQARNGKDKVKSKPKSVKVKKSTGKSTPSKSKDSQVEKIQLEGLKLPNLKLYYKNKKTRAENANWVQYNFKGQFCQAPKVVL